MLWKHQSFAKPYVLESLVQVGLGKLFISAAFEGHHSIDDLRTCGKGDGHVVKVLSAVLHQVIEQPHNCIGEWNWIYPR